MKEKMYQRRTNNTFNNKRRTFSARPARRIKTISYNDLMREVDQSKSQSTSVTTDNAYIPENRFDDFAISSGLKANIKFKGYVNPTPIQDKGIPMILEGKDVIGIANTGTGKTAAFLIPLIEKISKDRTQKVLIITPTRELASQIAEELRTFARGMNQRSVLCIGGTSMYMQKKSLTFDPNFVIGTPGRLQDLIRHRCLDLSLFNNVVLDEVDRMVDIGFIEEIKHLISLMPKDRQSLFFSATISNEVKDILKDFVREPIDISVKQREVCINVKQEIIRIQNGAKIETLHNLLIQKEVEKTLIFGRTKHGVQKLSDELVKRGFKAEALHGDKRQSQRLAILKRFKRNEISILLATDVASRGLDIDNISHVINYDLPECHDDYIHRIGRTGRGDKKGIAITFVE
ncbi:MAG: DEAD/DEAH box helicase [Patescibacteria group bacterium]|jgi:superfamily II DNA/RNA helicase